MRKKTISFCADKLFWFLVMILPLLILLFSAIPYELSEYSSDLAGSLSLNNILVNTLGISSSSAIYEALSDLFGTSGILECFTGTNNTILLYLTYCVYIEIIHVVFDVLVFIPRLAHKYSEKFTQQDD